MHRNLLDPIGDASVVEVVGRLGGVQAQVASSAEMAIRVRRAASRPGDAARALRDGRLLKTWAMRGALHLLTPDLAASLLAVIAAGRSWDRPSWQRWFGMTPVLMDRLRDAAAEALSDAVLTREELIGAIVTRPGLRGIADELRSGWGTLLKPLAWQGDLCFGPMRGTRVTFTRPALAVPGWAGLLDPADAGPRALATYLGAHGPATIDAFGHWLAGGYFGKRRLREIVDEMGDRVAEVEVGGERVLVLAEHLDELAATRPSSTVRLVPGFDQIVLGPGTADRRVVLPARRAEVSRQSGWISPVVVRGGSVAGTWSVEGDRVSVAWFPEAGRVPRAALAAEVERLSPIVGRTLGLEVATGAPGGSAGAPDRATRRPASAARSSARRSRAATSGRRG